MKKNILLFTLLLSLFLCLITPTSIYATTQQIEDQATLLYQDQIDTLNNKIEKIKNNYGVDLAIVTTKNKQGKTIEQYAIDYYESSNLGDDAMVFVLAMDTREWYILSQGYCVDVMDEYRYDDLESAIVPSLRVSSYYDAFSIYLQNIGDFLKQEAKYNTSSNSSTGTSKKIDSSIILGSFVAGPLIAFIILSFHKRAHRSIIAKQHASDYLVPNSFSLSRREDHFLYSNTVKTRKPEPKQNTNTTHSSTTSSSSSEKRSGRGGSF